MTWIVLIIVFLFLKILNFFLLIYKDEKLKLYKQNIDKKYSSTDWLFNYLSEPITKIVGSFKDKIVRLFDTNTLMKEEERKETEQTKKAKSIWRKQNW